MTKKERLYIPICENFSFGVGDVIELCGVDERGKSELVMAIVAHCILPKSLSGCECDVIYVNTNCTFKIHTLLQALDKKLIDNNTSQDFLDSVLDRFHLFTSMSIADCTMALLTLLHFPSLYSNTGVVIIDDLSAIQFESKLHSKTDVKVVDCVDTLKKISQKYKLVVILTHFLHSFPDSHSLKPWSNLVKYRFKVTCSVDGAHLNMFIQQTSPEGQSMFVTL